MVIRAINTVSVCFITSGPKKQNPPPAAFSSDRILNMQGWVDFAFHLAAFSTLFDSVFSLGSGSYAPYTNSTVGVQFRGGLAWARGFCTWGEISRTSLCLKHTEPLCRLSHCSGFFWWNSKHTVYDTVKLFALRSILLFQHFLLHLQLMLEFIINVSSVLYLFIMISFYWHSVTDTVPALTSCKVKQIGPDCNLFTPSCRCPSWCPSSYLEFSSPVKVIFFHKGLFACHQENTKKIFLSLWSSFGQ